MHPISYFQAVILGLTQGIAEPFPISSLGHGVVLPRLAGWHIHQNDKFFLTFLIATHLATAIVLLLFFLKDWVRIVKGLWRSLQMREIRPDDTDARLGWLLVAGTIPVGVIGLLLQEPLRKLFASPQTAAAFLIVNGIALLAFERLRRRPPRPGDYEGDVDARLARLSWRQAIAVGTSQAAALVPGISRSGFTMGGGLLVGLSNEDAARFGFLLATPVIFAAAALKLPELLGSQGNGVRGPAFLAGLCAAVTTFFAVKFLLRFFETNRLTPFGDLLRRLWRDLHARVCPRRLERRPAERIASAPLCAAVGLRVGAGGPGPWPGLEPGEGEERKRDDQCRNPVLGVVVVRFSAARRGVAREERGERVLGLDEVDNGHDDQDDAEEHGRHDQSPQIGVHGRMMVEHDRAQAAIASFLSPS